MPIDDPKDAGKETIIPPEKQSRPKDAKRAAPPVIDAQAEEIGPPKESREEHRRAAEAASAAAGISAASASSDDAADPASVPPSERAAPPPPENDRAAGRPARAGFSALAASAVLGGVIGAGLLFFSAQLMPPRPDAGLAALLDRQDSRLNSVEAEAGRTAQISERMEKLEQSVATFGEASQRLSGIEERLATQNNDALTEEMGDLRRRIEEVAAGQGEALTELTASVGAFEERLNALEKKMPAVAQAVTSQAAEARASSRAAALLSLRAAIEAGRPFAAELTAATRGAPAGPDSAELQRHAASGVASLDELTRTLDHSREAVVSSEAAAAEAESSSLIDWAWSSAKSVVRITRSDEGAGAKLDQMKQRLAAGDVAGAVAIAQALPDAPRVPLSPWLDRARARVEAMTALARFEKSPDQAAPAREG